MSEINRKPSCIRYLCGVGEEQDPKDGVADDSANIILVPTGSGGDSLFRVDLFWREM